MPHQSSIAASTISQSRPFGWRRRLFESRAASNSATRVPAGRGLPPPSTHQQSSECSPSQIRIFECSKTDLPSHNGSIHCEQRLDFRSASTMVVEFDSSNGSALICGKCWFLWSNPGICRETLTSHAYSRGSSCSTNTVGSSASAAAADTLSLGVAPLWALAP